MPGVRSIRLVPAALLAGLVGAGCYSPTWLDCAVRCDEGSGCPEGLACGPQGLCRSPGARGECGLVDAHAGDGARVDGARADGPRADAPAGPPDAAPNDAPAVGIVGARTPADPGRFADGTRAGSCERYRRPPPGYVYQGATGDGIYQIDVDGAGPLLPVNVYCDMTTDGGGWTALAANGEVALAETTEAGDCYPIITSDPASGCGTPSDLDSDFALPGSVQARISWRYLLALALGGTGTAERRAYFAIDFGVADRTVPERLGGTPYVPSGLVTAYGVIHCIHQGDYRIVHYTTAGLYCNDLPGQLANRRGTVFGHSSSLDMCSATRRTLGFTDAYEYGSTASARGLDDYQDGWSCSDEWVPQQARGSRMVVLVR